MNNERPAMLYGLTMDELRARIGRAPYKPYWDRMAARLRELQEWDRAPHEFWSTVGCAGRYCTPYVQEAALIHAATGDPEALAYAQAQIDKLIDLYLVDPAKRVKMWGQYMAYWSHVEVSMVAELLGEKIGAERLAKVYEMARRHFFAPTLDRDWTYFYRYLAGHNIPYTDAACAGTCALLIGEAAGYDDWQKVVGLGIDATALYLRHGFDSDGYAFEGTLYMQPVLGTMYRHAELLLHFGRANLYETAPLLRRIPDAVRHLLFPDRSGLMNVADGGIKASASWTSWLLLTAKRYGRPEDLAFWHELFGPGAAEDALAQRHEWDWLPRPMRPKPDSGPTGGLPECLDPLVWRDDSIPLRPLESFALETQNYALGMALANLRTSWGRDAVHLTVLGQGRGHTGVDHGHCDGGHFSLFAHGCWLAIDTGYWNVLEDQHSVMLIDGQGQFNRSGDARFRKHYAGRLDGYERAGWLDYARADEAHPRNCVTADRHVLFVRLGGDDAYVVILDSVNPDHGMHTFTWQLQAHPDSEVEITGPDTATVRMDKARLDCAFLAPRPDDFPTAPHSLAVRTDFKYCAYVEGEPGLESSAGVSKPYLCDREEARRAKSSVAYTNLYRPRLLADLRGPVGLLMTVIVPRRAGAEALTVRNTSGQRTFRADIECGPFTDTVIAALDHSLIRFPDVNGYAELAVIRRDPAGKVMNVWTLGGYPLDLR